jgi:hypothetical protein
VPQFIGYKALLVNPEIFGSIQRLPACKKLHDLRSAIVGGTLMLQIGAENKKQVLWMIVLLAPVALLVIYDARSAVETASPAAPVVTTSVDGPRTPSTLQGADWDARLHLDTSLLSGTEAHDLGERNIFGMRETVTAPKKSSSSPTSNHSDQPPAVQSSPPIPFSFYGFADRANEPRKIFLQDNGEVFIAELGEVVEGHYRVREISEKSVAIEDVLENHRLFLPLTK